MRFSGSRLRQIRRRAGLRVVDVCYRLDLSTRAVYSWEQGKTSPDADHLGRLAALFGVSIDDLFEPTPELVEAG